MQQRIASDYIDVGHVSDKYNPSDFLTKWVTKKKFLASVAYATNERVKVVP